MPDIYIADTAILAFACSTLFLFFIIAPAIGLSTSREEKRERKRQKN